MIGRWAAACDPRALGEALEQRRVLALLGTRLIATAPQAVAPALAQQIAAARERNAIHGALLEHALEDVAALLRARDIPHLPIKGPALARAAHGDLGLRTANDLDLLVARDDLAAASRALMDAGFAAPTDRLDRAGLPDLHLALAHPRHWGPPVELHWRVHWAEADHGQTILALSRGTTADRAAATLTVLLLCYARDGFVGPRLAADLAGWWDAHGDELAPRALDGMASDHPALLPVLATAAVVAQEVCGIPSARILGPENLSRARRRAVRLADPLAARDPQQLRAQEIAVDLLLGTGGHRRFVRRRLAEARHLPRRRDRVSHLPKTAARVASVFLGRGRRH